MAYFIAPSRERSPLLPLALNVAQRANELAETMPFLKNSLSVTETLGLAAYRTERFSDAVKYLDIAKESELPPVKALALAHLAMTKIRLGNGNEIPQLLDECAAEIEKMGPGDNSWHHILACQLALREATTLAASQTSRP